MAQPLVDEQEFKIPQDDTLKHGITKGGPGDDLLTDASKLLNKLDELLLESHIDIEDFDTSMAQYKIFINTMTTLKRKTSVKIQIMVDFKEKIKAWKDDAYRRIIKNKLPKEAMPNQADLEDVIAARMKLFDEQEEIASR